MKGIEAIIVDGVVYDVVPNTKLDCQECAFSDNCILEADCFVFWENEHFKRRENQK